MKGLYQKLADLPTTNTRIVVSLLLAVLTGVWLVAASLLGKSGTIDATVFGIWCTLLAAMMGIDYLSFAKKRETHQDAPPAGPDIEDAQAGSKMAPDNARSFNPRDLARAIEQDLDTSYNPDGDYDPDVSNPYGSGGRWDISRPPTSRTSAASVERSSIPVIGGTPEGGARAPSMPSD